MKDLLRRARREADWELTLDLSRTSVNAVITGRGVPDTTATVMCPGEVVQADVTLSPLQFLGRRFVILGDQWVETVTLVRELLDQTVTYVKDSAHVNGDPASLTVVPPDYWSPIERAVFEDAVARSGLPRVEFQTGTAAPAVAPPSDPAPRRPRRRMMLVVGAVGLCVIVAIGGSLFVRNKGEESSASPRLLAEPLEVFYGDDGVMDCRRAFTDVPASTMLRAGLDFKPGVDENSVPMEQTGGTGCVLRYRGTQVTADTREPPAILMTSGPQCTGEIPADEYRGWSVGEAIPVAGVAAEDSLIGQTAVREIPGHGCLSVGYPEDSKYNTAVNPPVVSDEVIREIIDGFEDSALPAVSSGTGTTFLRDDQFSCAAFYDSVTLSGLADIGVGMPLSDTVSRPMADMVGHDPDRDGADGDSCLISGEQRVNSLEIRTGSKVERQQGYPVPEPELAGWEQWERPIGPEEPASRTFEGSPSVNLRVCRDDDDCLSVSAYNESSSSRWADRNDYLNQAALDVAAKISVVEGFN